MLEIAQLLCHTLAVFLALDTLFWFLARERELFPSQSARLRKKLFAKHRPMYRYFGDMMESLGFVLAKFITFKKMKCYWRTPDGTLVLSRQQVCGYHLVTSCLVTIVPAMLFFGSIWVAIPATLILGSAWTWIQFRIEDSQFEGRLQRIQTDISYVIDMAGLYAGDDQKGGLPVPQVIDKVQVEFANTDLGEELGLVNHDHKISGLKITEALKEMHLRLGSDDHIGRFVDLMSAKVNGALSESSLQQLADELGRYRRNLLIDKAEKAKVQLSMPSTIAMFACLLVIMSPFLLKIIDLMNELQGG